MEIHLWTGEKHAETLVDIFLNQILPDTQALSITRVEDTMRVRAETPGNYTGHMNKFAEEFTLAREKYHHSNGFDNLIFPVVRVNLPEGKTLYYPDKERCKKLLGVNGDPRAHPISLEEKFEPGVLRKSEFETKKPLLIYSIL